MLNWRSNHSNNHVYNIILQAFLVTEILAILEATGICCKMAEVPNEHYCLDQPINCIRFKYVNLSQWYRFVNFTVGTMDLWGPQAKV